MYRERWLITLIVKNFITQKYKAGSLGDLGIVLFCL